MCSFKYLQVFTAMCNSFGEWSGGLGREGTALEQS